jgi:hypothetical protein
MVMLGELKSSNPPTKPFNLYLGHFNTCPSNN